MRGDSPPKRFVEENWEFWSEDVRTQETASGFKIWIIPEPSVPHIFNHSLFMIVGTTFPTKPPLIYLEEGLVS